MLKFTKDIRDQNTKNEFDKAALETEYNKKLNEIYDDIRKFLQAHPGFKELYGRTYPVYIGYSKSDSLYWLNAWTSNLKYEFEKRQKKAEIRAVVEEVLKEKLDNVKPT